MSRQTFELLILGSSSASPTSDRNPSGQLLNICERYFLIDCGEGTQVQLRRFKSRFQSISHVFVSHMHGDHFFGIPGLLSSMHLLGRKQPLNIYCPPQLKQVVDTIGSVTDSRFNFTVNWHFTSDNGLQLLYEDSKVEVFSFPLRHRIFCTGFLFREKPLPRKIDKNQLQKLDISIADINQLKAGMDVVNKNGRQILNAEATIDPPAARSYAYCSDTIYDPELVKYVKNVDMLYHESTFLEDNLLRAQKTYHSTARQAALVAREAGAAQLLLGHYSNRYTELSGFLEEAGAVFKNCMLAMDGKKFKI
jgi:ribonuclease Z